MLIHNKTKLISAKYLMMMMMYLNNKKLRYVKHDQNIPVNQTPSQTMTKTKEDLILVK